MKNTVPVTTLRKTVRSPSMACLPALLTPSLCTSEDDRHPTDNSSLVSLAPSLQCLCMRSGAIESPRMHTGLPQPGSWSVS